MNVKQNISLEPFNTFGVEAKAKYWIDICTAEDLEEYFSHPISQEEPFMVLSEGSNTLFINDFDGVILHPTMDGIEVEKETSDYVWLRVEAGLNWDDLVQYCVNSNWWGIENLSLIPGLVGAAPVQNIGAYGVEIGDIVEAVHYFDTNLKKFGQHAKEAAMFGYRQSIYKQNKGRYIIIAVTLKLSKQKTYNLSYKILKNVVETKEEISLQVIRDSVIEIRKSKLPNPKKLPNGGSFFKNPIVLNSVLYTIQEQYPDIPYYPSANGSVKIPAGWLIEKDGWKGKKIGNVGVHHLQALVIINHNHGTGKEIYDLSEKIIQSVQKKFGILLEREVNII